MTPTRTCPKCAALLPADAPQGHCPKCLLALAVAVQPGPATQAALEQATLDSGSAAAQSDQPALQFKPGEQVRYFGDYELIEEIARGGMGVVWKARQVSLNRPVAVKMILSGQLANEAEVKRFHIEAEAAANLQHPNIVAIHEIGEHEGRHYFSMDYVEGEHLGRFARKNPLTLAQIAELVMVLAEATQYAHQRGILHRDLKPQNILVDSEGRPHITDFGLAKRIEQDSNLTQEGSVMGSPSYMPPEQAGGRLDRICPATDVYALGAILYELLTSRAPFVAETPVATLRLVCETEPVRPRKLNERVPVDLETICLKCLEKDPQRRYATARELAEELRRFLNHESILARPAGRARAAWRGMVRRPWIVTGIASVLLLGLAMYAYGLAERVKLLQWKLAHIGEKPARELEEFCSDNFAIFLAVEFFLLQSLPLLRLLHWQAQGKVTSRRLVFCISMGLLQAAFGVYVGLKGTSLAVWNSDYTNALICLTIAALSNVWFGSTLVWQSLRFMRTRQDINRREPEAAVSQVRLERPRHFWGALTALFVVKVVVIGYLAIESILQEDKIYAAIFSGVGTVGIALSLLALRQASSLTYQSAILPPLLTSCLVTLVVLDLKDYRLICGWLAFSFAGGLLVGWAGRFTGAPDGPRPSLLARLGRLLWSRKTAYAVLFLFLFYLVEGLHGWLVWSRAKARVEARGEKVDWAAFAPSEKIPDEQNVFRHPFMLRHGIRQGWNGKVEQLDWLNRGYLGPGLNDESPVPLASLKTLPRARTRPASFASLNPELAATGAASESLVFEQAALADVVVTLGKQAGIQMAIETNAPPFAYPTNWQEWNEPAKRWDWLATNVAVQVSFRATNTTALSALETLLAQYHYQPESGPRSDTFQIRPVLTSLPELLARLSTNEMQLAQLDEALNRPQAQLPWEGGHDPRVRFQPNYVLLRTSAQGLNTRSTIYLLQGNADAALRDLLRIRRIADLGVADSSLVGAMIKAAFLGMLGGALRDGLAESLWPRSHLPALQELVKDESLLRLWAHAMQYERATELAAMRRLVAFGGQWGYAEDYWAARRMHEIIGSAPQKEAPWDGRHLFATAVVLMPRGWVYQNMAQATALGGHELVRAVDRERLTISTELATRHQGDADALVGFSPYHWITRVAIPNYTKSLMTVA